MPISDSDLSAQQIDTKERRKQLRIGRRRSEILDAAKQVFLAHDFAAVTIDEIAEAAGFSRATIYLYFKSKQEVYTGVLLRDLDRMISGLTEALNRADTVRNNLYRMSTSYMNFFRIHPEYFTTLSFFFFPGRKESLPEEAAQTIENRLADGISAIEEAIRLGIERGEARPVDARAATLSLWGQWMGNAYLAITGHTAIYERTIEQVYADGIEIFLEGLTIRQHG
ncbi:MAG: TetR/AcrR family transcriptional regulator [Rhizobiales bacterium]|nr:TetR/AcrR family transcriptional regulator [Hyphomicrobiales bacterium]